MFGAAVSAARGFSDFSGQRVGLIASRASVVGDRTVIDLLAESESVDLVSVFAAEHGIRADGDAGTVIEDGVDPITGLPVHSLYGSTRSPTAEMLADVDVLVFDLQDVGARFYTYTATMGLAMQAAAGAGIPFVVMDRPNPLGGTAIGGAVRDEDHGSFVGQYPIPAVHGMTAAELALAIRGEAWLEGLEGLDLRVVPMAGWTRGDQWADTGLAWVPPSPGLPNAATTLVYPATVLFEASTLSFGRGTDHPFGQIGAPWLDGEALARALNARNLPGIRFRAVTFTPSATPGAGPPVTDPRYEGTELSGVRLEPADPWRFDPAAVGVHLLAEVLAQAAVVGSTDATGRPVVIDRPAFFDLLAGTANIRQGLLEGRPAEEIVGSWSDDLARFDTLRAGYLLY